ncbi:hypothetical protein L3Q82_020613 [Scortum barcoo]|uniref:Uncharacterized protein n=1 Tax=Scortum barcoo TaxID=214431 RepID=A0ACB8V8W0_9TELE|nr:hypothetical protein L3Q82_020613 [Scortum barcoo]
MYDRSRSLVRIALRGSKSDLFPVHVGLQAGLPFVTRSCQDLQHVLEQFAAECEAAGMRIQHLQIRGHGSRPTGKGWRALSVWVERSCLKWRSSSISGVLFTSEGSVREIDRRIGAVSAVMRSVYRTVVVKKELKSKGEALDLPVNLRFPPSPMVINFG